MQNGTAGVYNCEVRPVKTTVQTVGVVEGVSARLVQIFEDLSWSSRHEWMVVFVCDTGGTSSA